MFHWLCNSNFMQGNIFQRIISYALLLHISEEYVINHILIGIKTYNTVSLM